MLFGRLYVCECGCKLDLLEEERHPEVLILVYLEEKRRINIKAVNYIHCVCNYKHTQP